jgi:hypothetical protein
MMRDPIYTTECEVIYTHAYVHADVPNTNTHACLARIPTFIPVHNAIVYIMHKRVPLLRALMRAGYVLHLLECLECGVVGKCCSNVLRSLIAYGVVPKAVRTRVCEKSDTVHVHSSRCAIPYTYRVRNHIHAYVHADIPNTNAHACLARIPTFIPVHNAIVYTIHKRDPLLRALMGAGYVLHSLECLECGVVCKCCSNVLRSLIAYGVVPKAVRTRVCKKSDTVHVHSS